MEGFFAAFPDAAYTLDDLFFAGDREVWRGRWQATQQGEWQGIAASGRNVTWTLSWTLAAKAAGSEAAALRLVLPNKSTICG
jgi:predicted ester cyclase